MNKVNRYLAIMCLVVMSGIAVTVVVMSPDDPVPSAEERIAKGEELAAKIVYFYDKRTDLAYAYMWDGAGNGGPAISVVPYEKVKDYLLNPPPPSLKE